MFTTCLLEIWSEFFALKCISLLLRLHDDQLSFTFQTFINFHERKKTKIALFIFVDNNVTSSSLKKKKIAPCFSFIVRVSLHSVAAHSKI